MARILDARPEVAIGPERRALDTPPRGAQASRFLPDRSGLDLQAALASTDCELPIVFISGHGDVPTATQALKSGAIDFLAKPFSKRQLLDAVGRACARSSITSWR